MIEWIGNLTTEQLWVYFGYACAAGMIYAAGYLHADTKHKGYIEWGGEKSWLKGRGPGPR